MSRSLWTALCGALLAFCAGVAFADAPPPAKPPVVQRPPATPPAIEREVKKDADAGPVKAKAKAQAKAQASIGDINVNVPAPDLSALNGIGDAIEASRRENKDLHDRTYNAVLAVGDEVRSFREEARGWQQRGGPSVMNKRTTTVIAPIIVVGNGSNNNSSRRTKIDNRRYCRSGCPGHGGGGGFCPPGGPDNRPF